MSATETYRTARDGSNSLFSISAIVSDANVYSIAQVIQSSNGSIINPATYESVVAVSANVAALKSPLTYTAVANSPFTLTSSWVRVATTTANTKALIISSVVGAASYDIEWTSVAAGANTPTDTYGEPVLAGEDFGSRGLPIGDIYLKSTAGSIAIVKTGA